MKLTLRRLDALIWVLIYGGLLMLAVGLALRRAEGMLAATLSIAGGVVALVGIVLIGVRARKVRITVRPDDASPHQR